MSSTVSQRVVLITGASGFVGRHCLAPLCDTFDEVHATYTREAVAVDSRVRWHRTNLLDPMAVDTLIAATRPTHLLHLAWVTEHGKYVHALENTAWLSASVRLASKFEEFGGRRIVTAGTCFEYDLRHGHCHERNTPTAPATLYGSCKHALRLANDTSAAQSLSTAHARLFYLFGPHEDSRRLVPSIAQSLLAGRPARTSHGEQLRDYLCSIDAGSALVALLASEVRGPVNIASGAPVRLKELIGLLGEKLGRSDLIELGALATRPDEPPVITADISRLRDEVAWRPTRSLEQRLDETLEWSKTTTKLLCRTPHFAPFAAAMEPTNS
jgi:nucleoside-diphosphate-sugar epimerase